MSESIDAREQSHIVNANIELILLRFSNKTIKRASTLNTSFNIHSHIEESLIRIDRAVRTSIIVEVQTERSFFIQPDKKNSIQIPQRIFIVNFTSLSRLLRLCALEVVCCIAADTTVFNYFGWAPVLSLSG